MQIFNLISNLDNKLATEVKLDDQNKIQLVMLLIECKYNLDIISAIDFEKSNNNDHQIREVIKLLSSEALEKLILKGSFKSDSFFMSWLYQSFNQLSSLKYINSEDQENNSPDESLLFNLYKRITVLKALATIDPPYTSLKTINYLRRLKNLNKVLLDINSIIKT